MALEEEVTSKDVYNLLQGFIKQSLSASEEIKSEIRTLKSNISRDVELLRKENLEIKEENKILKERILKSERTQKKYNLVFYGVPEQENQLEDFQYTINTVKEKLKVECRFEDFRDIYRIGNKIDNKERPLLVEVINFPLKSQILQNTKNLKGSGIFITKDYIPEDYKDQKYLRSKLQFAKQQNQTASIRGNCLIIDGNKYTIEELKNSDKEEEFLNPEIHNDIEIEKNVPLTNIEENAPDPSNAKKRKVGESIPNSNPKRSSRLRSQNSQ